MITPISPQAATAQRLERPFAQQAVALEGLLFAQLLRAADTTGPGAAPAEGSPFSSMLSDLRADAIAGSGQIGLAASIEASLMRTMR